jgi:hypothetical protein
MAMHNPFPYRYAWRAHYPRTLARQGQACRVLARGKMNSAVIEFEDGYGAVVSRNALRRREGKL